MTSKPVPFEAEHRELQETDKAERQANKAIAKMKSHLDEISKLMENIQINTNNIDDEVLKCEKIIESTFNEISTALEKRKERLLVELRKTAKNKKLSLLLQHNELNKKYQQSQHTINKHNEYRQNTIHKHKESMMDTDEKQDNDKNDGTVNSQNILLTNNFDLHFNSNHSKQLIQMINRFGSISKNFTPILLHLGNHGNNFVVCVKWKLPSNCIASIDASKIQKIRVEWSDTMDTYSKWKHKEFILSTEDKKDNEDHQHLINVGKNGTYLFRVRHYYLNKWSKMSNTKSISLTGISFDFWDTIYHGTNISVEGKCITKKYETSYQSAFLSNLVSHGVHKWRFKMEAGHKQYGSPRIFGICEMNEKDIEMNKIINTYFTNQSLNDSNQYQTYSKPFGDKCHEGDVIEMILDFNALKLIFKLNQQIYGKPMDIKKAKYKAVVSVYFIDDRIKLIGYSKNE